MVKNNHPRSKFNKARPHSGAQLQPTRIIAHQTDFTGQSDVFFSPLAADRHRRRARLPGIGAGTAIAQSRRRGRGLTKTSSPTALGRLFPNGFCFKFRFSAWLLTLKEGNRKESQSKSPSDPPWERLSRSILETCLGVVCWGPGGGEFREAQGPRRIPARACDAIFMATITFSAFEPPPHPPFMG